MFSVLFYIFCPEINELNEIVMVGRYRSKFILMIANKEELFEVKKKQQIFHRYGQNLTTCFMQVEKLEINRWSIVHGSSHIFISNNTLVRRTLEAIVSIIKYDVFLYIEPSSFAYST